MLGNVSAAQLSGAVPGETAAVVRDRQGTLYMRSKRDLAIDVASNEVSMSLPSSELGGAASDDQAGVRMPSTIVEQLSLSGMCCGSCVHIVLNGSIH